MESIRKLVWAGILVAYLAIAGCVRYEVGVNIAGPHRGVLVQHISLREELTALNRSQAQTWLRNIEAKAKKIGGSSQRLSAQEVEIRLPFANGQDLTRKFNQLFTNQPDPKLPGEFTDIGVKMTLHQSNLLLVERDRLEVDFDLRSLGLISPKGDVLVNPRSLFDLQFQLTTPWGSRSIDGGSVPPATSDRTLTWQLQVAQKNHIEAVFWLPSPIGLGTIAIVLLILAGYVSKYRRLPGQPS